MDRISDISSNVKRGVSNVGSWIRGLFSQDNEMTSPQPPSMAAERKPSPSPVNFTRFSAPQSNLTVAPPVRQQPQSPVAQREEISDQDLAAMAPAREASALDLARTGSGVLVPIEVPGGIDLAMNYLRSKIPNGMNLESAFPALGDQDFMNRISEADKIRQGLSNLLLLQGLWESILGRDPNIAQNNIFGVRPGGIGKSFPSPAEAVRYQLSPSALGGGVGGKMNILNDSSPLTIEEIRNLYQSYNPESPYIDDLIDILGRQFI